MESGYQPVLLVVDDDTAYAHSISRELAEDFSIKCAASAEAALPRLTPEPDVVLLDLRLTPDETEYDSSLGLLRRIREECPSVPVVMCTAFGDVDIAVECMRLGASDFVQKARVHISELRVRLQAAMQRGRVERRLGELEHELRLVEPRTIVGSSPKMRELKDTISRVAADARITVLIGGETGTGKELVARAIHASGPRSQGPYVALSLIALPSETMTGELFGYEAGAFTGASKRHVGYVERAHHGVLFLDEIAETPLDVQAKLLRFLEEREFERLGGTRTLSVDAQVIAATHADLEALVEAGKFREDLYFRIKVHEIHVPSLAERRDDIPLLVEHFLALHRQQGRAGLSVAPEALDALAAYSWPGNVRQLRNVIESASFKAGACGSKVVQPRDLPPEVTPESRVRPAAVPASVIDNVPIDEALARTELACVSNALLSVPGGRSAVADHLGYRDRYALHRRIRRLIDKYPEMAKRDFPAVVASFSKQK